METTSKWNILPTELCEKIFENVSLETLKNVSLVCKQWSNGSENLISKRMVLHCHKADNSMKFQRIRSKNLYLDCDGHNHNLKMFLKILSLSNVRSLKIVNFPFYDKSAVQVHKIMDVLKRKNYLNTLQFTSSKRSPEPICIPKTNDFSVESFATISNVALSHPGEMFNSYLPYFTNIKVLKISQSKTQKDYETLIHLIKLNQKSLTEIELENCVDLSFKVIISIMNLENLQKFSLKHCSGAYIIVSKLLNKYGNSNLLNYFDIENYQYEGLNHYGSVHHHIIK